MLWCEVRGRKWPIIIPAAPTAALASDVGRFPSSHLHRTGAAFQAWHRAVPGVLRGTSVHREEGGRCSAVRAVVHSYKHDACAVSGHRPAPTSTQHQPGYATTARKLGSRPLLGGGALGEPYLRDVRG